jgi:phage shock protein C
MKSGKKFYLDRANGKLMGVCAGIGDYFNVDATFVRIGVVVVTLLGGFPWTLIAYGAAAYMAKPKSLGFDEYETAKPVRRSSREVRETMRDIDRRMAEVERHVTSADSRLAREIEELR